MSIDCYTRARKVADAARAAMDASEDATDTINVPSHLAAALSLALDDLDRAGGGAQPEPDGVTREFASLQKLAMAGEQGEVSAHEACREIGERLSYLLDKVRAGGGAQPVGMTPCGQVTTHKGTGQQFFYRWPEPPYLDNASECVTVYLRETR